MKNTLVVTRHKALLQHLNNLGLTSEFTEVLQHVSAEDVIGRHVIGVLPNHLAALADSLTEIPINLPQELRGVELTLEQIQQYSGDPVTYTVRVSL
jgi:hypothetical protein